MSKKNQTYQEYHHEHKKECCGHGHHHEHEEECCGHEHHHEHGGECCGHEHHHEHEGECCGHEHHHEHGGECCGHGHHHEYEEERCTKCGKFLVDCVCGMPDTGEKKIFILENLGCANCAAKMEKKIQQLPGVQYATITYATKQLRMIADDYTGMQEKISNICNSIEDGIRVVERNSAHTSEKEGKKQSIWRRKWKELLSIAAGTVLFVGVEIYHSVYGTESFSLPLIVSFAVIYLILGAEVLLTAGKHMLRGQFFDENFLMSIATLGAFAIQEYPEAVGVMLFFRIGELFEDIAVERSRSQIMEAADLRPEVVNLVEEGGVRVIEAKQAKVGDQILVRPGDRIPLDSIVLKGESQIDTSAVTGEPVPVKVAPGDSLMSGCINTSGLLTLRVEKVLEESMVTKILNSVENAAAAKPRIDRFITRFSRIYTPAVILIALFTAVAMPLILRQEFYPWIYTALTFLVMSCPCALVLSVPLAFFCGIGAGSRIGILFKGGLALEALAGVKSIVMDKTGTITEGNFRVQEVSPAAGMTKEKLLSLSASCEKNSTHPIGVSIVSAAKEKGLNIPNPSSVEEIAGRGIRAVVEGQMLLCGNREFLEEEGVVLTQYQKPQAGSEVFLAADGIFAGNIVIADTIKKDAAEAINKIRQKGIVTAMLTGDSEDSAEAVAKQTGIQEVHARLLPQDKLSQLQKIRQKYGAVMFVGDGINDAPVLAGADVGAAMGSGADAAIEAADVVFMNSGVSAVSQSVAIAKRTMGIARQNIIFALAIKIGVMILGLSGIYANMWLAVFADTGVAFLCILNSIRALYKK